MGKITPSIKNLICYPYPITGEVSPDGKKVAFIQTKANWSKNRYERICYNAYFVHFFGVYIVSYRLLFEGL